MKTILYILQKEFIQIFRNRTMLPIIFIMPIVQLIILVHAATFEMKNIRMVVVDNDLTPLSRGLTGKFEGSRFFTVTGNTFSMNKAEAMMEDNEVDVILQIPDNFEKMIVKEKKAKVQVLINSINGSAAALISGYTSGIIKQYNIEIIQEYINFINKKPIYNIRIIPNYWYNIDLDYKKFMFPGILTILITVIGTFLTAINIVREKELGTIEQINVTPVKKHYFITGKLIPFWCIAMFEIAFGLLIGKLLFNQPMTGSISLIFLFASVYLLVALGFGLVLSTVSETQQQVMFMAWFFMVVFILMSGLFTPIESMPQWAQYINYLNPLAYFIKVNRMVLLKGSGIADIMKELICLSVYGVSVLSLAVWRYRKTT